MTYCLPTCGLQDANLPLAKMCSAYQQMVRIVRQLYQTCRLVHADLSEYNILVHKVRLQECCGCILHMC
jgi:RIO kinase 1